MLNEEHPLDRPVWASLTSGWAALARGRLPALRLDPRYGPFAAVAAPSPEALAALAELCLAAGELWIVERETFAAPEPLTVIRSAELVQMVLENDLKPLASDSAIIDLDEEDADEILTLATLTRPGPFAERTHRLGRFIGVREDGRLIAMAGERMRVPGFAEVSAVCTHPDRRGRGLAAALMSVVCRRMIAKGETPFLHSYAENAGAIALYKRLGFRARRTMTVTILARQEQA